MDEPKLKTSAKEREQLRAWAMESAWKAIPLLDDIETLLAERSAVSIDPYLAELEHRDGSIWGIVFGPKDTYLSTFYGDKENAEDIAAYMNDAYREGIRAQQNLPANWLEDSSLETWFPLTAGELKMVKSERDALAENLRAVEAERDELKHAPCPTCPKCGWYTCDHGDAPKEGE